MPIILHVLRTLREGTPARRVHRATSLSVAAALYIVCASTSAAQQATGLDAGGEILAGSEAERYLRALQLVGASPAAAWTIRPNSALSDALGVQSGEHPWKARFGAAPTGRLSAHVLRPTGRLIFNSSFAAPTNDGPTWAGRGLTAEVRGGVQASWGRLHLQVEPIAFVAQNQSFALAPNNDTGSATFRDARFPNNIDAPQRFGSGSYGRVDAGNSRMYFELPAIAVGGSTAAESWGPAREYPLVLSAASGGFTHAFAGTKQPVNLWLFKVHARALLGTLDQSAYSPIDTGLKKRWASAAVVTVIPRGIPGLEIGGVRFIEAAQEGTSPQLKQAERVFQGFNINQYQNVGSENQLASVFFRWAFPGAGAEVYGEYAKEDYSLDVRRLLLYPDDLRGYTLGIQRAFFTTAHFMRTFRFELVNAELSASNRGERGDAAENKLHQPYPFYLHDAVRQGHTNRGLMLGSPEAYGGAAWRAGVDQFTPRGRTSVTFERSLRFDWLPGTPETFDATHPDVVWALGAERMRFYGKRDYTLSIAGVFDMNRNLIDDHNVFNLRAAMTVRGWR